jgi:hypothetical protein
VAAKKNRIIKNLTNKLFKELSIIAWDDSRLFKKKKTNQ